MKDLSTTLLIITLLLLPLTVWGETGNSKTWNNRLVIPYLITEPSRHTPLHTTGTFLPPTIDHDLTLTPADNPVLLTAVTRIDPNATLNLAPGTIVYAHEFAGIEVAGKLVVQGTDQQPVLFTSNELHPLNQTWSGITVTKEGQATIAHAIFHHASPALTCLNGSHAILTNTHITDTILAVFNTSPNCYVRTF